MDIYDNGNAFSNLLAKKVEQQSLQTDYSCEESYGTDNYQEQSQVKVEEDGEGVDVDLDELERQLFGGGVSSRVRSWADETEEYFGIEASRDSFGETNTSLSGCSPRPHHDHMENTNNPNSLLSLARQLSSYTSIGATEGGYLTQRYSVGSNYNCGIEQQEGGWIQAKTQNFCKQHPNLIEQQQYQQQQQCSSQSNDGGQVPNQGQKKKTRRRKRGGRRNRRRSSAMSSSTQHQTL